MEEPDTELILSALYGENNLFKENKRL